MSSADSPKAQTVKPITPQNSHASNSDASEAVPNAPSTSQRAPEEKKQLEHDGDGDTVKSSKSKSAHSQVSQRRDPSGPKEAIKWGKEDLDMAEELEWGERANGESDGVNKAREWGVDNEAEEDRDFGLGTDLIPEEDLVEDSRGDDTVAFYDYVQDAKKIIESFLTDELPSLTPAPPTTSDLEVDYFQCPYCLRRFTEKFAPSHFEACSKTVDNNKKKICNTEFLRSNSQTTTSRSRSRYLL